MAFQFLKESRQVTDVYAILIREGSMPEARERFGQALLWDEGQQRFHEVGRLVVIPQDGDEGISFVMTCKPLSPDEQSRLRREAALLLGGEIDVLGEGMVPGWFACGSTVNGVRYTLPGVKPRPVM